MSDQTPQIGKFNWKSFYETINKGPDIALALVGAAVLDEMLKRLLEQYFIESAITKESFERGKTLHTFESKIRLAYQLGLIQKLEYQALNNVAEIRNTFAHSFEEMDFERKEIHDLIDELPAWGMEKIIRKNTELDRRLKFRIFLAQASSILALRPPFFQKRLRFSAYLEKRKEAKRKGARE